MTQHFPKFYRDINPQIEETLQMPSRINTKKRDQESQEKKKNHWLQLLWLLEDGAGMRLPMQGSDCVFPLAHREDAPRFSELAQMWGKVGRGRGEIEGPSNIKIKRFHDSKLWSNYWKATAKSITFKRCFILKRAMIRFLSRNDGRQTI